MIFFIYQARGPDVLDLWVPIESPGARLFPSHLRKVLESPLRTGPHRVEKPSGIGVGDCCTVGGRSGGWDGRAGWLLGRMMNSWNPALCFWVPVGATIAAAVACLYKKENKLKTKW